MNSFCSSFKRRSLPFNYLGVPLLMGAPKRKLLNIISDKILYKFDKWKGSTLSMASRLALINYVIYGSFLHSFMVYRWPFNLIKNLKKSIRNFIWTGDVKTKKLVSVNWVQCCAPTEEGASI